MKKIVSICSVAVLAFGFFGFTPAVSHKTTVETVAAGDCSIDGKWQIVSAEMGGQTMDMTSQKAFWEIGNGAIKSTSSALQETTDKYTRSGNTLTVIDSKSGEKLVMTIVKCSADAFTVKMDVEGTPMLQNMKKVK